MEPFVGEIRMFTGSKIPRNWALCDGQKLMISQHRALFAVIGTAFGGDGNTDFALPDLRGRVPLHQGPSYPYTAKGGSEEVTLIVAQLPAHTHGVHAQATNGTQPLATGQFWAGSAESQYTIVPPTNNMNPSALSSVGGNLPHENMMPYMVVNFIIALEGLYPVEQ